MSIMALDLICHKCGPEAKAAAFGRPSTSEFFCMSVFVPRPFDESASWRLWADRFQMQPTALSFHIATVAERLAQNTRPHEIA